MRRKFGNRDWVGSAVARAGCRSKGFREKITGKIIFPLNVIKICNFLRKLLTADYVRLRGRMIVYNISADRHFRLCTNCG